MLLLRKPVREAPTQSFFAKLQTSMQLAKKVYAIQWEQK